MLEFTSIESDVIIKQTSGVADVVRKHLKSEIKYERGCAGQGIVFVIVVFWQRVHVPCVVCFLLRNTHT